MLDACCTYALIALAVCCDTYSSWLSEEVFACSFHLVLYSVQQDIQTQLHTDIHSEAQKHWANAWASRCVIILASLRSIKQYIFAC